MSAEWTRHSPSAFSSHLYFNLCIYWCIYRFGHQFPNETFHSILTAPFVWTSHIRCCARLARRVATSWGAEFPKRSFPSWAPLCRGRPPSAPRPGRSTRTPWPTSCSWLCCRGWDHCARRWIWVRASNNKRALIWYENDHKRGKNNSYEISH